MGTVTSLRYHQSADGNWRPCSARDESNCPLGANSDLGHIDAMSAKRLNEQAAEREAFAAELAEASMSNLAAFDYAEPVNVSSTPEEVEALIAHFRAQEAEDPEATDRLLAEMDDEVEYTEDADAYEYLSEEALQTMLEESSSLYMPKDHTYKEPQRIGFPDEPGRINRWHGAKYNENQPLSLAQANVQVRKDLVEAQAKGFLPAGLSFNVRKGSDQTMLVEVNGLLDRDLYSEYHDGFGLEHSPAAKELKRRIESITDQYSHGHSTGPYSDYPHSGSGYFTSVSLNSERAQREEVERQGKEKAKRDSKKKAQQLSAEFATKGPKVIRDTGFEFSHESRHGFKVGRIPETDWVVVGTPSPIASGGYTYKVYDMTGVPSAKGRSYEEVFASSNQFAIDYRFGRRQFIGA